MKRLLLVLAVCATPVLADTYVPGYTKKDGTYVPGHYKSAPNSTKADNYSAKGNVNPYTGEKGTVDPYKIEPAKPAKSDPYKYDTFTAPPPKSYTPKY